MKEEDEQTEEKRCKDTVQEVCQSHSPKQSKDHIIQGPPEKEADQQGADSPQSELSTCCAQGPKRRAWGASVRKGESSKGLAETKQQPELRHSKDNPQDG